MIVFAGISPHPPILIPEIGKGEEKKINRTSDALSKLAKDLAAAEPDTIIVISPHMEHYPHLFNVCGMADLYGSFSDFGAKGFEWHGQNNVELAEEIVDKSEDENLPSILFDNSEGEYEIDHGVMVPLYFMLEALDFPVKILPISYSIASREEHYAFGQIISEICSSRNERIAIIASGDMSHRLLPGSRSNDKSDGSKFDKEFAKLIEKGDEFGIINMDEEMIEKAGECGYKSVLVLLGAISGQNYKPEIYSYEGPFGVGYLVANMGIKY